MKQIYYNGSIITMDKQEDVACIVVEDGIITHVGDLVEDSEAELIDLKNKTLLPAFIDAHSHVATYSKLATVVDLNTAKSIADILNLLTEYKLKHNITKDQFIIGFGYDNNFLSDLRHPNINDLKDFDNPVMLTHKSGHMGVLNEVGLAFVGYDKNSVDPEGGIIEKDAQGNLTGYLEEKAFIDIMPLVPGPSADVLVKNMRDAQLVYASQGIATAQDGLVRQADMDLLLLFVHNKALFMDIVAFIDVVDHRHLMDEYYETFKAYHEHFKIGGYKLFLDGSPQGRTAWMREAYADDSEYFAYPIYEDAQVEKFFKYAIEEGHQILVHCNGDAACEQMIRCYRNALAGKESLLRPVMVHAQLLQVNQIAALKELNIIPSYFVAHCKYWSDIHLQNFGEERGSNISPIQSTIDADVLFTMHQDSPVILPNMLETIQAAVTRTSIKGTKLNQAEAISVYDALKGLTINAAYQYFEEASKGSLSVGKRADLMILDQNPLTVAKTDIEKIKVLKTIKDGVVIYQA